MWQGLDSTWFVHSRSPFLYLFLVVSRLCMFWFIFFIVVSRCFKPLTVFTWVSLAEVGVEVVSSGVLLESPIVLNAGSEISGDLICDLVVMLVHSWVFAPLMMYCYSMVIALYVVMCYLYLSMHIVRIYVYTCICWVCLLHFVVI